MPDAIATRLPRAADQHPDIYPGSPAGVCGLFVSALQAHFLPEAVSPEHQDLALPWFWDSTPTPDQDAGGAVPTDTPETAQPARRLYIERPQEYPDARNPLPALLIGRGPISATRDAAGHRVDFVPHNDGSYHTSMLQMALSIDCCARNMGESESLADYVFHILLASGPALCSAFGLHTIEPPTLNTPEVLRRSGADIEAWKTTVYTQVMFQVYWRRWKLAPVLNEIRTTLNTNGTFASLRTVLQRRSDG